MTDIEFISIVRKLCEAENEAFKLRKIAEEEYERRYGVNPSDVDDDNWIDLTGGNGMTNENITIEDIEKSITFYKCERCGCNKTVKDINILFGRYICGKCLSQGTLGW